MKRGIVVLIVLIALLLTLTACFGEQKGPGRVAPITVPSTAPGSIPEPTKNVEILGVGGKNVAVETVAYFGDVEGYFAVPSDYAEYPGVVMIHEWWGLNSHIKEMARKLASEGYMVLAVDIYEGTVAKDSTEASILSRKVEQTRANENMKAALAYLKERGATKLGSLGWCFGGGQSFQLSQSEDLDATVIYYGRVNTDPQQITLRSPVLGIFAENDQGIPPATVNAFKDALGSRGIIHDITIYPGVGHAFANPSGAAYNADASLDAWAKTLKFLDRNLK